ncbi:hypothetical protein BDY19DRAFT_906929 [Irpex rosettiformis]|uniref:Uncharacterized protein n=1 Tax=Irpex rosettiformis TaxID=378272 RepID=A0ACB8U109_9APHY|nr:hypothetical protein BDY19DRAFT_906929 [Irpex rosettiformis]
MSQHLSTGVIIRDSYVRTPASTEATLMVAQKTALTRKTNQDAARVANEAIAAQSLNRAMSKAKEDRVWLNKNTKKHNQTASNAVESYSPTSSESTKYMVLILSLSAIVQQSVQYDDVQDDHPSGPVAPVRSLEKKGTAVCSLGKKGTAVHRSMQPSHASLHSVSVVYDDSDVDRGLPDLVKEKSHKQFTRQLVMEDDASSEDSEAHHEATSDSSESDDFMPEEDDFSLNVMQHHSTVHGLFDMDEGAINNNRPLVEKRNYKQRWDSYSVAMVTIPDESLALGLSNGPIFMENG